VVFFFIKQTTFAASTRLHSRKMRIRTALKTKDYKVKDRTELTLFHLKRQVWKMLQYCKHSMSSRKSIKNFYGNHVTTDFFRSIQKHTIQLEISWWP